MRQLMSPSVMCKAIALAALLSSSVVPAQTSTSYQLEEYAFNAGGTPAEETLLTSTSFSITLASIGDGLAAAALSSSSFQVDVGFDVAYLPPGEVLGLVLTDKQTLVWNADPSAGQYNLYRDDTSDGYGNCQEQILSGTTTTDSSTPSAGNVFHYLVTVENRLAEEGSKGFQGNGIIERLGSFDLPLCP